MEKIEPVSKPLWRSLRVSDEISPQNGGKKGGKNGDIMQSHDNNVDGNDNNDNKRKEVIVFKDAVYARLSRERRLPLFYSRSFHRLSLYG